MPSDSPVTPEPMKVEVVCPDCDGVGYEYHAEQITCHPCHGKGSRALPLSPPSLAARYIELGRAVDYAEGHIRLDLSLAVEAAIKRVRQHPAHPDFRPAQKEGTHDGE